MASSSKQTIGNYTVLQTLGTGSFGKVKLAVHSQTGHKVALKIIGRSKLAHSDMVGRVNREIQYLKMLRHPHIIKLYEVITTATDIIMVIEYAGGELFNYIVERGRMSEKDARRFFQQMVSAVEYCHRRNIVHRDLKPENVLLDPYDNVKVADFGLSNIMKDGEFLQTSCGSPNYAAPEVINGKLYAGPEVDAWSCGVILYVMMCGRLPFDDDHIPALFKKITSGVFTMPGYLSQGARAVLSGLLQVDPLKRMTLAQCRQHAWFMTDLPEYLRPLPESTDIEGLARLDESILGELERQLEMDRATLVGQLRQRGTNPAKVAYQLTLDNRHVLEQSRNSNKQGIRSFALASSPPAAFHVPAPDTTTLAATSSIGILSTSLPRVAGHTLESQMYKMRLRGPNAQAAAPRVSSPLAPVAAQAITAQAVAAQAIGATPPRTPSNYFRAALPPLSGTPTASGPHSASSSVASLAKAPPPPPAAANPYSHRVPESGAPSPLAQSVETADTAAQATSRKRAKATRTRWHFGIRSRSPPADVMAEVYRALQQLQMTWKHFGPFRLRAKTPGPDPVKIDLQLYKLDARDNYLVDFKAVIPQVRDDLQTDSTPTAYRAGENTLIAPPPPFIQAARRRLSAATQHGAFRTAQLFDDSMEPRSLDDQFLDSNYPIQLPAELPPAPSSPMPAAADRSDMLPEPDTLPARTLQRRLGGMSPPSLAHGLDTIAGDSSESMVIDSVGSSGGLPIPTLAVGGSSSGARAMDIPRSKPMAASMLGGIGAGLSIGSNPSGVHFVGGTPRSQGRAPGSYMPGSVVGRVSLARADVSLTADGVGAGNGSNRQSQERVVNIFPFFDVCCRLITELAVPSVPQQVPGP
ncbi:Protein kinase [Coemansia spiralis]|uniref:non-specific serine/threonine protein kinase n=1 Tax=Coemansia spiralis TaxID=417178 RepID=A0A9W8L408_9FUNG|nr:Protein kinase [Coemansia spiralis]